MKQSRAPVIIAIVLLLLPLYVGSYFALVDPDGKWRAARINQIDTAQLEHYRYGNSYGAAQLFWPLEQIDRKARPGAWATVAPSEPAFRFVPERTTAGGVVPDNS
jgi:hypothetical protein